MLSLKFPFPLDKEIIIVDDGSTDKTREILKQYSNKKKVSLHFKKKNSGKGAAIREGLKFVTGDYVIIQDADMEYSIDDYARLLEPLISGRASVVYGSRFLGKIQKMKLPHRMFNIFIRSLVNILYGTKLTDEATAYKVFRTGLLKELNLKSQRFAVCPEMTAKVLNRGITIHEVPIHYRGRNSLEGKKIRWYDGFEAIYTLLKYRFCK